MFRKLTMAAVCSILLGAPSTWASETALKPWERSRSTIHFEDRSDALIGFNHPISSGDGLSGVAWLDYDNDGWLDFYVANAIGHADGLMRNNQDGTFTNRIVEAGIADNNGSSGVAAADLDNDGDDDLVVLGDTAAFVGFPASRPIRLFANNGDGTFTDVTPTSGLIIASGMPGTALQPALADINNDGLLDLFVTGPASLTNIGILEPNHLFLNTGDLTFTDISAGSELDYAGGACVASFSHFDEDGWIDLFIGDCNIAGPGVIPGVPAVQATPIRLYRNNGDLTFTRITDANLPDPPAPETQPFPPVDTGFWMCLTLGDFDNDGDFDLFSTNAGDAFGFPHPHYLLERRADDTFLEIGEQAEIPAEVLAKFAWGCSFSDFNNDGWDDLAVVGNMQPLGASNNPGYILENQGDRTVLMNKMPVDLSQKFTSGLATADYDKDGYVDVLISASSYDAEHLGLGQDQNGAPVMLRNKGGNFHSITLQLEGRAPSNRSAVGARVKVKAGSLEMTKEVRAGSSFISQDSLWLSFGLGHIPVARDIEITWPSGRVQTFQGVRGNRHIKVVEGEPISRR